MDLKINKKPTIGITCGDPGGIGAEVIAKSLSLQWKNQFKFNPIIIGSKKIIQNPYIQNLLSDIPIHYEDSVDNSIEVASDTHITVLDIFDQKLPILPKTCSENGRLSFEYLKTAIDAAMCKKIDGIVTGPISKESWNLAGISYTGHTTCLKDLTQSNSVSMGFYSSRLKTVLATVHIPLSKVAGSLTESHLDVALKNTLKLMQLSGIKTPKIALAGLNPHAGENGQFGTEEKVLLAPFVEKNTHQGLSGPYPADTLYHRAYQGEFDCVISLYHDQGLIPIKLVAFHEAVNITLGLPFLRTSPDHGTCFELHHQNKANPSSMDRSIDFLVKALSQCSHSHQKELVI